MRKAPAPLSNRSLLEVNLGDNTRLNPCSLISIQVRLLS